MAVQFLPAPALVHHPSSLSFKKPQLPYIVQKELSHFPSSSRSANPGSDRSEIPHCRPHNFPLLVKIQSTRTSSRTFPISPSISQSSVPRPVFPPAHQQNSPTPRTLRRKSQPPICLTNPSGTRAPEPTARALAAGTSLYLSSLGLPHIAARLDENLAQLGERRIRGNEERGRIGILTIPSSVAASAPTRPV